MFVRHLLNRGFLATVAIGAGVSFLIELTQLTGDWGLYPCAYRYFSTADLITNTIGAGIGAFCAPLLGLVPGQKTPATQAELRKVTPGRRFLAALCNVALIAAVGFFLLAAFGLLLDATRGQLFVSESIRSQALRAFALVLVPGTATFLAIPLLWQGRTPGEWAVLLRPTNTGPGSRRPDPMVVVARFALVQGPMLLVAAAGVAGYRAGVDRFDRPGRRADRPRLEREGLERRRRAAPRHRHLRFPLKTSALCSRMLRQSAAGRQAWGLIAGRGGPERRVSSTCALIAQEGSKHVNKIRSKKLWAGTLVTGAAAALSLTLVTSSAPADNCQAGSLSPRRSRWSLIPQGGPPAFVGDGLVARGPGPEDRQRLEAEADIGPHTFSLVEEGSLSGHEQGDARSARRSSFRSA